MTLHLVLDLETIHDPAFPLPEDPTKLASPPEHQIVSIGCMAFDNYSNFKFQSLAEGKPESEMIAKLVAYIEKNKPTIVTWNGRGFDMPVIVSRALKYGLRMPWWFTDRNTRYRYSIEGHFDLMDFLSDFGATRNSRLDVFAKLVGLPGKLGVDGSQVGALVATGHLDEVNAYCLCDVAQTALLFLRVERLRGALTDERFEEAAKLLFGRLRDDPRTRPVVDATDEKAYLMSRGPQPF